MPELPDVEVFRQKANKALNKKLDDIDILDNDFIGVSKRDFKKYFKGKKFTHSMRRGKYIFLTTEEKNALVMHFGMTGDLKYLKSNIDAPEYTKISFKLKNKHKLHYRSKRKLGRIELTDDLDHYIEQLDIGPDALEVSEQEFLDRLQTSRAMIKSSLTDQSIFSGIGNVYADEILFQAGVHPKKKTNRLSDAGVKKIYKMTHKVLNKAIEKEADVSKLPKSYLLPHRKEGSDCPKCDGKIKKIKISGRSTLYCPSCQNK